MVLLAPVGGAAARRPAREGRGLGEVRVGECASGAALRLLPLLLAPERGEVEEVVGAAGRLTPRAKRVRVEHRSPSRRKSYRRELEGLLALDVVAVPAASCSAA